MIPQHDIDKHREHFKERYAVHWRDELVKLEEQFNAAATRFDQFRIKNEIDFLQGKHKYVTGKLFELDLHWIPPEK